ncbi:MAG: ABC transporter permease [Propionibacteriaceae bacterium]|jgi:ribose transport system permease protein|nr:ABC transporter permease [Propionibacteriaceae bacterium]
MMFSAANPDPIQDSTAVVTPEEKQAGIWKQRLQQLLAFAGLLIIFLAFSIVAPTTFATYSNVMNILFSAVVIGCLAMGATLVIVSAGIDLSVGTGMALCAVMAATFMVRWGLPVWLGILLTLAFGAFIGLINGTAVTILGLPPFIATLAMMMICQGLALVVSNVAPIYFDPVDHASYMWISTGNLIPGSGFPNAIFVLILAVVVAYILFNKTILGRYDVSIGSNMEATALSGINVKKWLILIYAAAGTFTALGGIMISARLGSAQPATGAGYEMQAIAATVIGGTSLAGGKGSVIGTLIGALIISVINNGLQIIMLPQQWQNVVLGTVIVVVVFIDQLRNKQAKAR